MLRRIWLLFRLAIILLAICTAAFAVILPILNKLTYYERRPGFAWLVAILWLALPAVIALAAWGWSRALAVHRRLLRRPSPR